MATEAQREQAERRETLLQDADLRRRQERERGSQGSTYLDHHHSELGGRFGAIESESVTGRPSPAPPPLPANSPWSGQNPEPGMEPPLGYRIDQMSEPDPPANDPDAGATGGADAPFIPLDVEIAPPLSHTKEHGDG
jgi:hypothetical protein